MHMHDDRIVLPCADINFGYKILSILPFVSSDKEESSVGNTGAESRALKTLLLIFAPYAILYILTGLSGLH